MTVREYLQHISYHDFEVWIKNENNASFFAPVKSTLLMYYDTVAKYATIYASTAKKAVICYQMVTCRLEGKCAKINILYNGEKEPQAIDLCTIGDVLDLKVCDASGKELTPISEKRIKKIALDLFDTITFYGYNDKVIRRNIKKIMK